MGTYLDDVGFALTLTNLKPKFDALAEQIGDLDQLDTTAKTDLVAAINEVKSGGGIKRFTGTDLNDLKTPGVYISDEQKLHLPSENIGDWIIIVTGTMAKTQYALPPDDASLYCRTMTFWSAVWTEWKTFAKTEDVTGITGELSGLTTSAKTNLVAAVNEVLATANKKLDLIQLEPTSTSATVDIPTGGCVLVVTANHTVTLTFNGNAGDLVILVNNTTGNIRNFALSPVLPSNNIAVILMDGEHAGQSLFRTDVIPDSVAEVTGDLENLTTTAKDSLVAAINEIAGGSGGSSDLPIVVSDTLPEDDYIPKNAEIRITTPPSTSNSTNGVIDFYTSAAGAYVPSTHAGLTHFRISNRSDTGYDIKFRYRDNAQYDYGTYSTWFSFKDILNRITALETTVYKETNLVDPDFTKWTKVGNVNSSFDGVTLSEKGDEVYYEFTINTSDLEYSKQLLINANMVITSGWLGIDEFDKCGLYLQRGTGSKTWIGGNLPYIYNLSSSGTYKIGIGWDSASTNIDVTMSLYNLTVTMQPLTSIPLIKP